MQRHDVASTLSRHYIYVICLPGYCLYAQLKVDFSFASISTCSSKRENIAQTHGHSTLSNTWTQYSLKHMDTVLSQTHGHSILSNTWTQYSLKHMDTVLSSNDWLWQLHLFKNTFVHQYRFLCFWVDYKKWIIKLTSSFQVLNLHQYRFLCFWVYYKKWHH